MLIKGVDVTFVSFVDVIPEIVVCFNCQVGPLSVQFYKLSEVKAYFQFEGKPLSGYMTDYANSEMWG